MPKVARHVVARRDLWTGHTGPPEGPLDLAFALTLERVARQPSDLPEILHPLFGLARHAGEDPVGHQQLGRNWPGLSGRARWLGEQAQAVARELGPPQSLLAAVEEANTAGIVSERQLVDLWLTKGHMATPLSVRAVSKIIRTYGLEPRFRLWRDRGRPWPLVVVDKLRPTAVAAERGLRRRLREQRLIPVADLPTVADGLTAQQWARLLDGLGYAAVPDGRHVVSPEPDGIDHGLGRALCAAERGATTEQLCVAIHRWGRAQAGPRRTWALEDLALYLDLSPLYAQTRGRWELVGSWATLTELDQTTLCSLEPDGAVTRSALLERLILSGRSVGAAEQVLVASPVVTPLQRGRYVRMGCL